MTSLAREIVRPRDATETARLVAEAAAAGRTVRVRGNGTKDYLGDLAATDVTLETLSLAGVVDHVPADLTITAAAGTTLGALQAALAGAGQFLPVDPPHADGATLGGIVASGSDGFWRWRYGGIRDLLIGARVALADGTVVRTGGRVVKNVAGYDLGKLLVGSFGTLGVIVELTFKVSPLPAASAGGVVHATSAAHAFALAATAVRGTVRPSVAAVEARGPRDWRFVIAASGDAPAVERALADAARAAGESGAELERLTDIDGLTRDMRDLPATAVDGALVRAALPLSAQAAYAERAAALDGVERVVADSASGIVRAHLRGESVTVIAGADALSASARVVGGAARVERRAPELVPQLRTWGTSAPGGHFLMRRIKEALDPSGALEPLRSAVG